jgi:4-hydroxy-3-polyprenylbenzoate decarboxylase
MSTTLNKRLVVALSGASGAIYGIRTLEVLARNSGIETHLIVSKGARATIAYETEWEIEQVTGLADHVHDMQDLGASIASGTFRTSGMVVAPCSIKTLSAIANAASDNLIARSADVCLKERRRLVLVTRETPLNLIHLRLATEATQAGAVILPPVPGFYVRPQTIMDVVDHTVTKILDQFDIDAGLIPRWEGP